MLLDPSRENRPGHHHPYAKAVFSSARPADFWRFSPLRSEVEWERSERRLDVEAALVRPWYSLGRRKAEKIKKSFFKKSQIRFFNDFAGCCSLLAIYT